MNVNSAAGQTEILNARNSKINTTGYGCDEFYNASGGYFYTELTVAGGTDGSGGGWLINATNTLATPLSNGWHLLTTTVDSVPAPSKSTWTATWWPPTAWAARPP